MELDDDGSNLDDIIDQRDGSGGGGGGGAGGALAGAILGGILSSRRGKTGGGIGTLVIVVVLFLLFRSCAGGGFDLGAMGRMDELPGLPSATGQSPQLPATGDPADLEGDPQRTDVEFAGQVVTDANDIWEEQFAESGRRYERTKIVLYDGGVNTACGAADSSVGPFYCPADGLVYLDLSFWSELAGRFDAAGDFAQAYVIAHEVGHHVQNQLGISAQVRDIERRDPSAADGADGLSVRVELQADCLAGVWAHTTYQRNLLERGDMEEAIAAATAVGDDTIQRRTVGRVRPDSFTHGSSEQRVRWFRRGFESGNSDDCDTFSVDSLSG